MCFFGVFNCFPQTSEALFILYSFTFWSSDWIFSIDLCLRLLFMLLLAQVFAEGLCVYVGACLLHSGSHLENLCPPSLLACAETQGHPEIRDLVFLMYFLGIHITLHMLSLFPGICLSFSKPTMHISFPRYPFHVFWSISCLFQLISPQQAAEVLYKCGWLFLTNALRIGQLALVMH